MSNIKKISQHMLIRMCCFFLSISFLISTQDIYGAQSNSDSGVVRVKATYTYEAVDEAQQTYEYTADAYCTGFLVAMEEDTKQYLITTNNIVTSSADAKSYEVSIVVSNDITVGLSLATSSAELGISMWELDKNLYDRDAFIICDDGPELQYQDSITLYGMDTEHENCQTLTGTVQAVSNVYGVSYIYHDIATTPEMLGGPIVNADNQVIGINTSNECTTGYAALDIKELTGVMDSFGIDYSSSGKIKKAKQAAVHKKHLIIIIVSAVVAVILLTILIVLLVTRKKRKAKKEQKRLSYTVTQPAPVFDEGKSLRMPNYQDLMGMNKNSKYISSSIPASYSQRFGDNMPQGTMVIDNMEKPVLALMRLQRVSTNELIDITNPQFVIGKDPSQTDYSIRGNNAISRAHAVLVNENHKFYVVDKNATNGTFVNNSRVFAYQKAELHHGDELRLADERFLVLFS